MFRYVVPAICAVVTSLLCQVVTCAAQEPDAGQGEPIVIGSTYTVVSTVLGTERRLSVRLPLGYVDEPERTYPVVVVIDGGPEQDFPHIAGIAQSRDMNWTFEPFILVGVETVNRRHEITPETAEKERYTEWMGAEPGGSAQFRDYLRKDVLPWIESRYRSNGRTAVIGESLAALFIVETLFEEPDLFDDYIAISPSLWWDGKRFGVNAADYLAAIPAGDRRLYLTIADEGDFMQDALDDLVAALEQAPPPGLRWVYIDRGDSETHASIYHEAALDAFRLFYPMPARIYPSSPFLNGKPRPELTADEEALLREECDSATSAWATPGQTRGRLESLVLECFRYDYGAVATAGNLLD